MEHSDKIDILDNNGAQPIKKKLWTIRLLLLGGGMIALTFLAATFWGALGLNGNQTVLLALSMMVSFGINIAGFIIGFVERKKNPKRSLIGIFGNLVLIIFFISIVAYSLTITPEMQ